MASPLFNVLGANALADTGVSQLIQEVKNFQRAFNGDPKNEVQKMMNEGRLSQSQFNEYAQMANQIMAIMGGNH